jgi:hypothetical protein
MKYILIFYAFWPGTSSEGMIVEPFDTLSECEAAAERMWKIVQADGASSYQADCGILKIVEAQEVET